MKQQIIYSDDIEKVLRTMACNLGPYNYTMLHALYERFSLRIVPLERNTEKWIKQGQLIGDVPRRYNTVAIVCVNPKCWADIMRTISPEELAWIATGNSKWDNEENMAARHFSKAFMLFLHGEPFEDELRSARMGKLMTATKSRITEIIMELMKQPDYWPFVKLVGKDMLGFIFYVEIQPKWLKMSPEADEDMLRALFWENPDIDEAERHKMRDNYLYNVEFLLTGRLGEVLAKMDEGTDHHAKLTAIKHLHEGNAVAAMRLFDDLIGPGSVSIFDEPLTNFAYAVAIGVVASGSPVEGDRSARPQARHIGEKLMKARKVTGDTRCYAMLIALYHYIYNDAGKYYKDHPLTKDCKDKMCLRLAVLFMHHYQILEDEPNIFKFTVENVVGEPFYYLQLLFAHTFQELTPIAAKLKEQTGLDTSLLPKVKRIEEWERTMNLLLELNKPRGTHEKSDAPQLDLERVAYIVNLRNYDVQPKLQKSKDGGVTWTKGRNISLKSFETDRSRYMTAQDRQVARLVKCYSYGWYGQTAYELNGIEVVAALAGCQSVFDEKTDQRIDIVEEPLQLTVLPHANGFTVRSNVDLDHLDISGVCLTQEGDKQVSVVRVKEKQKQTLGLLRKVGIFPPESKQQLTQLLQNISGDFTVMSPLLKNATDLKHVDASPLIAVQIAPAVATTRIKQGEQASVPMFNVALAVKPFGTQPPYQQPGIGMEIVSTKINGERVQTERDLKAEKRNLDTLRERMAQFDEDGDNHWVLDTEQCLTVLETVRTMPDVAFVEWPQGVRMRVVRQVITADKLRLKISSAGQWFELEGEIQIGDKEKIKMAELLQKVREAEGNFIRLEGDEYIALSEQLRRQLQAIDKMTAGRGKELKVAAMNGLQLSALEELGATMKADEQFRQLMNRIQEAEEKKFSIPTNIHAELRPYQVQGYVWMSRLAHWGAGACLADDMGLGKTLQAITLMQSRASQGPQLVIMPTSVLLNWQQELQRFAPAMTVHVLNQGDRKHTIEMADAGDVVLSTYGLLVTEAELLASRTWTTIVLDEAHTIKNRVTQTSKGAMQLKADFRLMLTGTPLQNHLSEIWNLFQFAAPGLLGTFQQFADRFILPIERDHDQERQRLLRRLLAPFLLRRTKDDVLNELPDKTEITMRVELSQEEQALYDNMRQQAIANLEQGGQKGALQAIAEITRLRQAACHPKLINSKLEIPSSKTQAFLELVTSLLQNGHRALVFSQFTSHLALIRKALDNHPSLGGDEGEVPYLYLDGSTTPSERNRLVKQFQTGDTPLFLISLKAGGLGLNLTAADYVIHLDPWWNPAIEDQASDRAHRIGQERPVTVYRLIAAGTIEEKILRLHGNKRSMADALLQEADMFTQVTADDIIRLLRESVDAIK